MKIAKCTWDAVVDADGYNVYLDGVKVNQELITDTHFYIQDLEPNEYEAYATSVQQGIESDPSVASVFIIEAEVVAVCDAAGVEMGTDIWTMRVDEDLAEIYISKWNANGTLVKEIAINHNVATEISSNKFVGFNGDETEVYFFNRTTALLYAHDVNGDLIRTYDPTAEGLNTDLNGDRIPVSRDGRIALYHSGNSTLDNLQIVNSADFSLLHSRTLMNTDQTVEVGPRAIYYDGCGNLILFTFYDIIILDSNFQEIYRENRDVFFTGATNAIGAIAFADNSLYVFSNRSADQIEVVLFDLSDSANITFSTIATIDTVAEGISNNPYDFSGIVDNEGTAWITAPGEDIPNQQTVLIRVTNQGVVTVWSEFASGPDEFNSPLIRLEYTSPAHKLLASTGRHYSGGDLSFTKIIDIATIDDTVETVAAETEFALEAWSRFVPGQYSAHLGTDTSTAPE